MKLNKELLKGSTPLLLLKLLSIEDMYGYEMIKRLEILSDSTFHLKQGSLYPVLHSLEEGGFIVSFWENTESERRKKYYHLTEKGRKKLDYLTEEWKVYSNGIGLVLNGGKPL